MPRSVSVLLYRVFGRFPRRVRLGLVRLFSPSYTLGAICMIERPDDAVLLVRHVYRPGWGIPGGLLQRGEEPADAARREVYEEIGLHIDLVGEPVVVVSPEHQRVDLVFRARPVRLADLGHVRPRSAEIGEVRWFAPDALPQLQRETATAMVALARAAVSPQVVMVPMTDAQLTSGLRPQRPIDDR